MLFSLSRFSFIFGILNYIVNYSLLNAHLYGWFATGSLFYEFLRTNNRKTFLYASTIGIIADASLSGFNLIKFFSGIVIIIIFILPMIFKNVRCIFESSILNFIGFISYPLYLIHENALIAMIIKINKAIPNIPKILLPVFPILILIIMAFLIAKYAEPYIRRKLMRVPLFKSPENLNGKTERLKAKPFN